MGPYDLLAYVSRVFEDQGMPYLVTGSTASIFYGEPRMTNDIDIVVAITPEKISAFCSQFPTEQFYLSRQAVTDAVANKGQFSIIHPASGLKVDVMVPEDSPFNRSRLQRKRIVEVMPDVAFWFATPEDVIVKKMEYFKLGGSDKHLRDITGVLKIAAADVDRSYIQDWATRLGLMDVWVAVLDRVDA